MTRRSPGPPESLSDHALLAGLAGGDTATGQAFVRRFQGRVYGVALNVLGDRGLAEDVAQEAFVRAWRHAEVYDPGRGAVAPWLLRITRNLAIDTLRRRRPQPVDPNVVAAIGPATTATAVEDAAVTSDLAARTRAVVGQLPPEQAKALLLAAFYGRTAEQISRSEDIPVGTAKSRIRLGRDRVRAQLVEPTLPWRHGIASCHHY
jgi:RNA polymerase sigma factor (sigma-70 family)